MDESNGVLLFLKYLRPLTPLDTSIPILHFQESRLGFKCNRGGLASYPENVPSEFSHFPVLMRHTRLWGIIMLSLQ
jgi:hypothetical protein